MVDSVERTEVLVAGAGPTGLALACSLLMQGVSVRVVDEATGPATTSRANFLHARGSEVLGRLGALGELPNESLPGLHIRGFAGGRQISDVRFGDVAAQTAAPPMLISQARIEKALRDRLAELGGAPEWNAALVDVREDDVGVTARLGTGETVHADWLVGCDGTHSMTRRSAGIGFPGVKVTERFLLADLHLDWDLDRRGTSGWTHSSGMLGVMPLPDPDGRDDLWRLLAYPDRSETASEEEILDQFREILPTRTGNPDIKIRDAVWLSTFSVHRRLADSYRQGRVFIAGDAAHTHAPFGGQGMLTGLGDAENLAWKLALVVHGLAADALLDTYQAERRPLATTVLRGTTAATRNVTAGPVGRLLVRWVLTPIVNLAWVQRRVTFSASQLWVSYRRGPLGRASRFGRRPRRGDRVPDMECSRMDGTRTRLHAEVGRSWALLIPESGTDHWISTAANWLGDMVAPLRVADDRADEVLLVRPDAHLAWRGRGDSSGLVRWFEGALREGRTKA